MSPTLDTQLTAATAAALRFWFDEPHSRDRWFASTPEFDAAIKDEFGSHLAILGGEVDPNTLITWPQSASQSLGLILLCDQFPRNIYRGQAQAFAFDAIGLGIATTGVALGQDRELNLTQRAFFYLPFEHAENRVAQHTSVGLFTELRDAADAHQRQEAGTYLHHAHQHRDIILRFGRFPHRNAALGRNSSPEEAAFAAGGAFGQ